MSTTQADLNKIAAQLAAVKAKQEALAKIEKDLKAQALDLLEDVGFTTVDCPKGRFQVRELKSYIFSDEDKDLIKTAKAAAKLAEDSAKDRATVLFDPQLAFTPAKKVA